jgi:hypothetical protein
MTIAALSIIISCLGPAQVSPEREVQLRLLFQQHLDSQQFDAAGRVAIRAFRPDLHCAVFLRQASDALTALDGAATELESADVANLEQQQAARQLLADARRHIDQMDATARDYVEAGWSDTLLETMKPQRDGLLQLWSHFDDRLDSLMGRAKPFELLIAGDTVSSEDIAALDPVDRLRMALYLVDTGRFDQARNDCLVPLRLGNDESLKGAAEVISVYLENWHREALENRKWFNLVGDGLDAADALRQGGRLDVAVWMVCLVAHLARDHYDVPVATIEDVLVELEAIKLGDPATLQDRLLAAKIRHEHVLLGRRAERSDVPNPPHEDIELFVANHFPWYAAEAALMAAARETDPAVGTALLEQCLQSTAELQSRDPLLASAVNQHIERLQAVSRPFEEWLSVATAPDYRDTRGTVLPDVLIDDRAQLVRRVRRGFEKAIAMALDSGDVGRAFELAQRGKALSAGRTLGSDDGGPPRPITVAELQISKLMTWGTGGQDQIPIKELFIEYYFGPTRAWVFYMLAPENTFEPLRVVEIDHTQIMTRCRGAIAALQAGQNPADPGQWMLGREKLDDVWSRLVELKQNNPMMRRVVIAPDGPMCYLPLDSQGIAIASEITVLPTAAVLLNSRYISKSDARLMWNLQARDLEGVDLKFTRDGLFRLWKGAKIKLLLKDGE